MSKRQRRPGPMLNRTYRAHAHLLHDDLVRMYRAGEAALLDNLRHVARGPLPDAYTGLLALAVYTGIVASGSRDGAAELTDDEIHALMRFIIADTRCAPSLDFPFTQAEMRAAYEQSIAPDGEGDSDA